jgi:hypothetical protein
VRTLSEETDRQRLKRDFRLLREDKDAVSFLLKLSTLDPQVRKLLCDLIDLLIKVRKAPALLSFLEAILELPQYKKSLELYYQDVRMLEEAHPMPGLNLRDLALLECRHILGREAFLELLSKRGFDWLCNLSLSSLYEEKTAECSRKGGAPLSPSTVSAYIKLCCLASPERIIKDEIEDSLKQSRRGSTYEIGIDAKRAYQKAAKRLQRLLRKIGFLSKAEFENKKSLLALLMMLGTKTDSNPSAKAL